MIKLRKIGKIDEDLIVRNFVAAIKYWVECENRSKELITHKQPKYLAITFDGWTFTEKMGYLEITRHFICEKKYIPVYLVSWRSQSLTQLVDSIFIVLSPTKHNLELLNPKRN